MLFSLYEFTSGVFKNSLTFIRHIKIIPDKEPVAGLNHKYQHVFDYNRAKPDKQKPLNYRLTKLIVSVATHQVIKH